MILYLDTSALLKKYFRETGSDEVIARWKDATGIVTSSVAYAEALASIHRKKRDIEFNNDIFQKIIHLFRRDWNSLIRVEVTDELNGWIDKVVSHYPLRGFDAIHLASALIVHDRLPEKFLFACYDNNLVQAAQSAGLQTLPELPDYFASL
jgi:predicted nucleic acid-binding protein